LARIVNEVVGGSFDSVRAIVDAHPTVVVGRTSQAAVVVQIPVGVGDAKGDLGQAELGALARNAPAKHPPSPVFVVVRSGGVGLTLPTTEVGNEVFLNRVSGAVFVVVGGRTGSVVVQAMFQRVDGIGVVIIPARRAVDVGSGGGVDGHGHG